MTESDSSQSQTLCKSCGLCCSGHLFAWVRLNANELDKSEALGLNVIRNDHVKVVLYSLAPFLGDIMLQN